MDNTLQIALCDDEPLAIAQLKRLILQARDQLGGSWELHSFTDPSALLDHIQSMQVVFLDVDMPGADGYEIGRSIRMQNKDCCIIMATGDLQRFTEAFEINALRYVKKPFDAAEVENAMKAVINSFAGHSTIALNKDRITHDLPQREILYFHAYDGYVEAHTKGGTYRKDTTLDAIEELIDERIFYRVHRSYIVGLFHVDKADKKTVYIGNNEIPISRKNTELFQRKLAAFDREYR